MSAKRVLSVGQCYADQHSIGRTLQQHFGADVSAAATVTDALTQLRRDHYDLVLVNRILDMDGSAGLDLIEKMKADEALKSLPVMLVSNYESSQEEALSAGAERGFGKASLGRPAMLEAVGKFLT